MLTMLRYGFFRDFKGSDTLLFGGSSTELLALADLLRDVATGVLVGRVDLDRSNGFLPSATSQASVDVTSGAINEAVANDFAGRTTVTWKLSPADAKRVELLVRDLAAADRAVHEFLEDDGDIQIIGAKDEYPPRIFEENR